MQEIHSQILERKDQAIGNILDIVSIPSVSSDPNFAGDIRECTECISKLIQQAGGTTEIVETKGHPAVLGELINNHQNKTIMIYNHADVQPADRNEWIFDPFKPHYDKSGGLEGMGRIYGRGSTDDKGPLVTALTAASIAVEDGISLNFKFVYELEEESGSINFGDVTLQRHEFFEGVDSVLISDGLWAGDNKPSIEHGLRGLVYANLNIRTAAADTHSGTTGGVARNPIGELCEVISQCYEAKGGYIRIPGFYNNVTVILEEEMDEYLKGFDPSEFKKDHGLEKVRTESPREMIKRLWAAPTFEVHGIAGGYPVKNGKKTIVPGDAQALISLRIVPNQNPLEIFDELKKYVGMLNPDVVVNLKSAAKPFVTDYRDPHFALVKQAYKEAFGLDAVLVRAGGTIGAVTILQEATNSPIIFMPMSLPSDGYHKINEKFEVRQYVRGAQAFLNYFKQIAQN